MIENFVESVDMDREKSDCGKSEKATENTSKESEDPAQALFNYALAFLSNDNLSEKVWFRNQIW